MAMFLHRFMAALCAACLLAACGGHDDDVPLVTATILNGEEQVPANGSTALASGAATFDWDGGLLIASVYSPDVTPTEVHLHDASGGGGTVVAPLGRVGATAVWQASVVLSDAQLRALEVGNFYFDVHTATYPAGEIRGRLFRAFPPQEHVLALQQAAPQSLLLAEQLRQLDDYEDWWHGGRSGVGLGLSFGF
ncbi:MAG TPA: CHRD domain-containing protein [Noviherbaspirillum sp.]|jgi:hypothetical protein|uniref:CHRD domain-containing protein n=1 Tax=Noviherbaspirillum sp. TaxID=1926288 RepID=UPI002F953887